jgi:hypothetical protein
MPAPQKGQRASLETAGAGLAFRTDPSHPPQRASPFKLLIKPLRNLELPVFRGRIRPSRQSKTGNCKPDADAGGRIDFRN